MVARSISMGSMVPVDKGEMLSLSLPLLHSKGMAVCGGAARRVIDVHVQDHKKHAVMQLQPYTPCPCMAWS